MSRSATCFSTSTSTQTISSTSEGKEKRGRSTTSLVVLLECPGYIAHVRPTCQKQTGTLILSEDIHNQLKDAGVIKVPFDDLFNEELYHTAHGWYDTIALRRHPLVTSAVVNHRCFQVDTCCPLARFRVVAVPMECLDQKCLVLHSGPRGENGSLHERLECRSKTHRIPWSRIITPPAWRNTIPVILVRCGLEPCSDPGRLRFKGQFEQKLIEDGRWDLMDIHLDEQGEVFPWYQRAHPRIIGGYDRGGLEACCSRGRVIKVDIPSQWTPRDWKPERRVFVVTPSQERLKWGDESGARCDLLVFARHVIRLGQIARAGSKYRDPKGFYAIAKASDVDDDNLGKTIARVDGAYQGTFYGILNWNTHPLVVKWARAHLARGALQLLTWDAFKWNMYHQDAYNHRVVVDNHKAEERRMYIDEKKRARKYKAMYLALKKKYIDTHQM